MSITLPPLAWPYTGLATNIKEMIRARDLEVARVVLEGAAEICAQYQGSPEVTAEIIRALEVRHHE